MATNSMARSAELRGFEQYLRTGVWADPLEMELKFNPNHDPADGRFTSGAGGGASHEAARASRARADSSLGPIRPIKLQPLSAHDVATVHGIAATPSLTAGMNEAWATRDDGNERGFFIYYDGDRYYRGPIVTGTKTDMTSALYESWEGADPLRGRFGYVVAVFHTHPATYENPSQADNYDQNFSKHFDAITIIKTRKGYIVGR